MSAEMVIDEMGISWMVEPGTDDGLGPLHESGLDIKILSLLPFVSAGVRQVRGVLLDIGAHVGHYTVRAAKSGHRVIAVEANPSTAGRLLENVVLNNVDDRVRIIPHPAWDELESMTWEPVHSGRQAIRNGSGRVRPEGLGMLWPVVLDDILGDEPKIDVVKLDTEGAELHVLRGLRATLHRTRPVMVIEKHDWTGAYHISELLRLLDELDYVSETFGGWGGLEYLIARPRPGQPKTVLTRERIGAELEDQAAADA